jgi:hypothetical protein
MRKISYYCPLNEQGLPYRWVVLKGTLRSENIKNAHLRGNTYRETTKHVVFFPKTFSCKDKVGLAEFPALSPLALSATKVSRSRQLFSAQQKSDLFGMYH